MNNLRIEMKKVSESSIYKEKAHSIFLEGEDIVIVVISGSIRCPILHPLKDFDYIKDLRSGDYYVKGSKWMKDPHKIYS